MLRMSDLEGLVNNNKMISPITLMWNSIWLNVLKPQFHDDHYNKPPHLDIGVTNNDLEEGEAYNYFAIHKYEGIQNIK